ncbi:lysoplasmalogenase family protein [Pedobacter sp. SYP-B3415]|uniref:lysoplasmalogenase family protein n=1 Tax=Pedobacter sp. SYP-B3415 TaxID=2496641 RepID=UPI00101C3CAF|nr:lysoplasmalogenase family protein [Pedobacter sp. SYP-B3415]
MSKTKVFNLSYAGLLIAQLGAMSLGYTSIATAFKPMLIVLLLIWLVVTTRLQGKFRKYITSGLLAAGAADILLSFPGNAFFTAVLALMSVSYMLYIRAFSLDHLSDPHKGNVFFKWGIAGFGAVCAILMVSMHAYLGSMRLPVLLYSFIFSWMGVMAVNRFDKVSAESFRLILAGVFILVVSSILLITSKFYGSGLAVDCVRVFCWLSGQYLVTEGTRLRRLKVLQTPVD